MTSIISEGKKEGSVWSIIFLPLGHPPIHHRHRWLTSSPTTRSPSSRRPSASSTRTEMVFYISFLSLFSISISISISLGSFFLFFSHIYAVLCLIGLCYCLSATIPPFLIYTTFLNLYTSFYRNSRCGRAFVQFCFYPIYLWNFVFNACGWWSGRVTSWCISAIVLCSPAPLLFPAILNRVFLYHLRTVCLCWCVKVKGNHSFSIPWGRGSYLYSIHYLSLFFCAPCHDWVKYYLLTR